MSGSKNAWDNNSDVLQGISSTSQAELSPHGHSELTSGDPSSFLGFQIGADANTLAHNHGLPLNQWWSPKQSTSPTPQLEYAHYSSARFMNNQDSWNPLQVTGVPANVTFAMRSLSRTQQIGTGMEPVDRRCSDGHHSPCTSSETGETASQYNGLHSSDSGYSSRSCATRSIAAASYAVDSAYSPFAQHDCEQDEKPVHMDISSADQSEVMDVAERLESPAPSLLYHDSVKCHYPGCSWFGKCPSDKRKHEARHKKLFKCDEPKCTRKEGFGTINDLARHKKCVHKKEPERGPKVVYMCFGLNCPRSTKKWPRLDNFRQHLARMHSDEDVDGLLRRSREWYQNCMKPHDTASVVTHNLSMIASPQTPQLQGFENPVQKADRELQGSFVPIQTAFREDHDMHEVNSTSSQPVGLAELSALDLEPKLEQKLHHSAFFNQRQDKMDDMISEAAHGVINAMTKMINNHQRRRGHLGQDEPAEHEGELSDRNREILQKILSTASKLLSESSGGADENGNSMPYVNANSGNISGSANSDWIQHEIYANQSRLHCE